MDSPAFAFYEGPTVKWVKRLAFEGVNAQFISTTNHIATHLDSPIHFYDPGPDIAGIPIETLVGPACIVDLAQFGIGDYQIYGPEHFEEWERKTGITIERGDILVIHTGYHHYYNEDWYKVHNQEKADLPRAFLKHPGPQRRFVDWVLDRGIRWLAVDCIAADHPFNTNVRRARPDLDPGGRGGDRHVARRGLPLARGLPVHARQALPARRLPRRERRRPDRRGARPAGLARLLPLPLQGRRGGVRAHRGVRRGEVA